MAFKTPALFFIVLLTFGALLGLCTPTGTVKEESLTNGQRMARGMPLNPPKFMRDRIRSNRATPVVLEERHNNGGGGPPNPHPSPKPPVTWTGRLQVRYQSSGSSGGYVRNWSGAAPISGVNFLSGVEPDLEVSITFKPHKTTRLNILATNPRFAAPFYVGAGGSTLVPNERSIIAFTNVEQTQPGALPGTAKAESAIWSLDTTTKKLTAYWINEDGSTILAQLAYDVRANALFFVSDVAAYNAASTFPASAVDLFLVPL
ncbi:hypothetical protein CVT24_012361 [Panaeolus cyanescens]|uniref:Uncharacterized protein n=1 Tax=Panaeolus cyanescens TaxID=181874 RepID=A0A409YYQ0_9AGAR|nr:hypothetical protein CVT24_012361 [Panaeolus cyanescens]